jgi:signal transduction histidine kinase
MKKPKSKLRLDPFKLGLWAYIYIGLMIIAMILLTEGHQSPYYAGINLVILGMAVLMPWRFKDALIVCIVLILSYNLGIFLFDTITNPNILVSNNFFLFGTIVITLTSTVFSWNLRYKQFKTQLSLEKTNAELESANTQLKELDTLKSNFLATISHEMRTPLTLILTPVESFIKRYGEKIEKRDKKYLELIHSNALKLFRLINDILDLARLKAAKVRLNYQETNIVRFVDTIVSSVSPLTEHKKIALSFQASLKDGEPYLWCDPEKIEKVILNLLGNAIKFTPEGGAISLSLKENREKVQVEIKDTGIGIAPEYLERIFERFSQVETPETRRYGGAGIGLALAKEFIELHGGNISVSSKLGEGSCFSFTLPKGTGHIKEELKERRVQNLPVHLDRRKSSSQLKEWAEAIMKEEEYRLQEIKSAGERRLTVRDESASNEEIKKRYKILLIEDDPGIIQLLSTELMSDYFVLAARDGIKGWEMIQKQRPDLVICDIMLPKLSGTELCQKIKKSASTAHIPVILLTAKVGLEDKIEALKIGADDYLTKPFSFDELRARIASILNIKESQAQILQVDKMASLGQLVAGLSHEIFNPLGFIQNGLENLKEYIKRYKELVKPISQDQEIKRLFSKTDKMLSTIEVGIKRIKTTVKQLKTLSFRDSTLFFQKSDVHEGIDNVIRLLKSQIKGKITVHKEFCSDGTIECAIERLNQVFMNIMLNSIQAISDHGDIWIKTYRKKDLFQIYFIDNGCGIPQTDIKSIFNPFFTTKDPDKGTGLGLSISYAIIREHKGDILVESDLKKGTTFKIILPISHSLKEKEQKGGRNESNQFSRS